MTPLPHHTVLRGDRSFDVSVLRATAPTRVVSFIAGRGGNPERHAPLLLALAEMGCTVVAPHYPLLATPRVDDDVLTERTERARLALDAFAPPGLPVVGIGHSLGASAQLVLAGAQAFLSREGPTRVAVDSRLTRLVLFAPAASFLLAPDALDALALPVTLWAGTEDAISPPASAHALAAAAPSIDVRIAEGAGHFSFMHDPPPNTTEPLPDRDGFLAALLDATVRDVMR